MKIYPKILLKSPATPELRSYKIPISPHKTRTSSFYFYKKMKEKKYVPLFFKNPKLVTQKIKKKPVLDPPMAWESDTVSNFDCFN